MIETIAFDFGRVIAHFDHGRTLGKLTPFTDMPPEEMFAHIYGGELEDEFESGRVSAQEFLRRFLSVCRLGCDEAFLAEAVADIFWPNEPVCALIPRLRPRYRLVLASNTNPIHARKFVPQLADTLRHFNALVLSHEVGARKPSRAFYERVIAAAGVPEERCLFIDDLPANVAGATECGMHGLVYTDADTLRTGLRRLGVVFDNT